LLYTRITVSIISANGLRTFVKFLPLPQNGNSRLTVSKYNCFIGLSSGQAKVVGFKLRIVYSR